MIKEKMAAAEAAKINGSAEQAKNRLSTAAMQGRREVICWLETSENGLSRAQVNEKREAFGSNKITQGKKKSLFKKICEAFFSPFTLILFCLAAVSCVTDIIIPLYAGKAEDINAVTVVIILTMVLISGLLRFVQEQKSGNAARRLLDMITTTTCVQREGAGKCEIPLEDVVVGDIVHLAAGDMVPADLRILEAKDLFISQGALTGESAPVEKTPGLAKKAPGSVTESPNLAFMGSNVVSGCATAAVVSTGDGTLFGSMAQSAAKQGKATSFEKGVNSVSWVLIRFMLVMVPLVFFINGVTKGDWVDAFLFAISIAVGLTPEMLPMIVTTCLAKGAVSMSKKKTVVKNLSSIQNFGAMDVLCTDKTGTLTQDKVVLEYHMDIHGKEDPRVLRHAFLNSFYQTGLKNLMDMAIIERTKEESRRDNSLRHLMHAYEKVDEVPFDFSRRRMSVVVKDQTGKTQMITKGAVEEMLSACDYAEYKGKAEPLTCALKEEILHTVETLNDGGMRVIAVAQKTNPSPAGAFGVQDERGMVLIGYLAFLDPPKESAKQAIEALLAYGVKTKILTGDNERVTRCICKKVGIRSGRLLLGCDLDNMSDKQLAASLKRTNVFAKLSPDQKERVVRVLRENGNTVGFMGDGINDAPALKAADIGISVDSAVDIAKESADIILLEKNLMVLKEGIIEGRKTYANMIKYIKMTASSNFGNMFSVLIASAFLPFLPMMSIHLIILNLIYDLSCTAIPWDNVDNEFLRVPRTWDASSVGRFMLWIGPTSSVFDIVTYLVMYFIICPAFVSHGVLYNALPAGDEGTRMLYAAMFQAGWFVESMWSQTLVIHMIRTPKLPFLQSRASFVLTALTCLGIAALSMIPYTPFGGLIGLAPLPGMYWPFLFAVILLYMALATCIKKAYVHRYGELL